LHIFYSVLIQAGDTLSQAFYSGGGAERGGEGGCTNGTLLKWHGVFKDMPHARGNHLMANNQTQTLGSSRIIALALSIT